MNTVTPLQILGEWMEEARAKGMAEPEAMSLATATASGIPSVRIVLCRGIDERGLRFFTNYDSRKGAELESNPQAAVAFYWAVIGRQVRVEGSVERLPPEESDAYFQGRARGSRLSAWASPQSRPIASADELYTHMKELFALYEGREVPRPPHWGGYLLRPKAVELWKQ